MGNALPPGTQISPDGRWYWDGRRWAPVSAAPPSYPRAPYAYAPPANSMAVVSLVTGILSWLMCPFAGAVLAVIFGHVARGQIKQRGEGGGGMAVAGLVLGYLNLLVSVGFFVVWVLTLGLLGAVLSGISVPSPSPSG